MLPILKCGQMEHARTARTGLTLAKLVLSVTLTGTTLSDNHRAGLSVEVWHSHWQSHVSTGVVALFGSPHASAGFHLRCLAAYTQVQACNLVVMQPTRECGFASTLCHAAHMRVRVCIHVVLQPTHMCRFAPTLSTYLAAHKQARCDYVVNPAHSPGFGHTQAQSCIFALCTYGCSPGALDLPCCVTDSRAAEGGDSDASGAGGPTKTLFASLDISISCDKDKDLDGQRPRDAACHAC